MTLEQAMAASSLDNCNSAFRHPISGGVQIVDGSDGANKNYWVQQPNRIVRQHYPSMEAVKEVVDADNDDWQPYK